MATTVTYTSPHTKSSPQAPSSHNIPLDLTFPYIDKTLCMYTTTFCYIKTPKSWKWWKLCTESSDYLSQFPPPATAALTLLSADKKKKKMFHEQPPTHHFIWTAQLTRLCDVMLFKQASLLLRLQTFISHLTRVLMWLVTTDALYIIHNRNLSLVHAKRKFFHYTVESLIYNSCHLIYNQSKTIHISSQHCYAFEYTL